MKKLLFILLAFISFVKRSKAQEMNYAVSNIDSALLINANAVLRTDDTKLIINDIGNATLYRKYAITILNEGGDDDANFIIYYDNFRSIESIKGELFDANGVKIRTMKKDDLKDYGAVADFELISDSR